MNVYFTYILFDWMAIPRYVGKGKDRRDDGHETGSDPINWMKNEFIEQTWIMLGEIPKIRVVENVSEREALDTEVTLIRAIGRFPNGPLTNMSDGGDGWGKLTPEEYKKRGRKANDALTPAQKSERAKRANANRDVKEMARKIGLKKTLWWSTLSLEERRRITNKWSASITPEKRLEIAKLGGLAVVELHKPGGAWALDHAEKMRQLIWINNGQNHKRVDKSSPIPEGWQRGRINLNIGLICINDGQKNRRINKLSAVPEGWKRGVIISNNNFMWITNGRINRKIDKSHQIPEGWRNSLTLHKLNNVSTRNSEPEIIS